MLETAGNAPSREPRCGANRERDRGTWPISQVSDAQTVGDRRQNHSRNRSRSPTATAAASSYSCVSQLRTAIRTSRRCWCDHPAVRSPHRATITSPSRWQRSRDGGSDCGFASLLGLIEIGNRVAEPPHLPSSFWPRSRWCSPGPASLRIWTNLNERVGQCASWDLTGAPPARCHPLDQPRRAAVSQLCHETLFPLLQLARGSHRHSDRPCAPRVRKE